ncbi:MAG: hypothetical protein WAK69_20725, partial [Rhodoplanes sp.]
MANRGRQNFVSSSADDPLGLAPKRKRPGHRLRAQSQSSNFGTRIRVAESCQHKNDDDLIFSGRHRVCPGICVTLRIPFGPSSQSRIQKRPDQRVERDAQIAEI